MGPFPLEPESFRPRRAGLQAFSCTFNGKFLKVSEKIEKANPWQMIEVGESWENFVLKILPIFSLWFFLCLF